MPLEIVEKPEALPLDLTELKAHLNMDGVTRFDTYLQLIMKASVGPAQEAWGIQLITATLEWNTGKFRRKMELPRPPLQSVESVEYRGTDGNWQTVDPANYQINLKAQPGFVRFNNDYEQPDTYEDEEFPWRFTYKAGFTDDQENSTHEQVPSEIRLRMMNSIGTLFMKREDTVISSNSSVNVEQLEKSMAPLIRAHNKRMRFG